MVKLSPEAHDTLTAVVVLALAYVAVHWHYYLFSFPRQVLAIVDPRDKTLMPQTQWGLVGEWIDMTPWQGDQRSPTAEQR